MMHRSVLRGQPQGHLASNERLEYLGDAVVNLVVADYLFRTLPEQPEGVLTRLRARLVRKEALAMFAHKIGLPPFVKISEHLEKAGGRQNTGVLADALEALIGAIYLDQGYETARRVILNLIQRYIDLDILLQKRENYKSLLLEEVQARKWAQPEYIMIAEQGPDHRKMFTMEVRLQGEPYGRGTASNKKSAEQLAAQEALQRLKSEPPISKTSD